MQFSLDTVASEARVAKRDLTTQSGPLTWAKIVVVEDEALLAQDLTEIITEAGASVAGPLRRMSEAMDYSDLECLDAALLDVDIADDEVFAFADRLRAGGVPIVFHTGRTDHSRLKALYPDARIVCKPCLASGLVAALSAAIYGIAMRRRAVA